MLLLLSLTIQNLWIPADGTTFLPSSSAERGPKLLHVLKLLWGTSGWGRLALRDAACTFIKNTCIYYAMDRDKEGKEGKRFHQMIAKWLNRSAFGWSTLYLTSRVLGAEC